MVFSTQINSVINFYVDCIETRNNYTPEILKRLGKKKKAVIEQKDIEEFKITLGNKLNEFLTTQKQVCLITDYEPLFLLRDCVFEANIADPARFMRLCGFPLKSQLCISHDRVEVNIENEGAKVLFDGKI